MRDELPGGVRAAAELPVSRDERAQRIPDLIRTATGRRWVGVYEVTPTEVVNLTALVSTGSEMIVPIVVGDRVVGTLDVEDESTDAFSDEDRRLFEHVAGEMGPLYA
jgi:GAF domain-containing protein